jgi:hypothetical protein
LAKAVTAPVLVTTAAMVLVVLVDLAEPLEVSHKMAALALVVLLVVVAMVDLETVELPLALVAQ